MKPAWDQLIAEYAGHEGVLVADVDCTSDGADLCEQHNVGGYPTIKWGDPEDLKDYNGGRSYDDLSNFAAENLGPIKKKTPLEKFMLKANKEAVILKSDVDHILQLRKNAAVLLLLTGVVLGLLVSFCLAAVCCPQRAKAKTKPPATEAKEKSIEGTKPAEERGRPTEKTTELKKRGSTPGK
eukprot:TRINITY_DN112203_c0_g1_i1.p2 TRINITY_DN112203_c0_g1~~TRINITY_DN112203_c0_g1_i1.p2  ORF type:complete len:182 (+),score=44.59 TRINITY_DN112203_c0_g1_i1:212-757(+)